MNNETLSAIAGGVSCISRGTPVRVNTTSPSCWSLHREAPLQRSASELWGAGIGWAQPYKNGVRLPPTDRAPDSRVLRLCYEHFVDE